MTASSRRAGRAAAGGGGGGGGGGGAADNPLARVGQAKNGLMGGMSPTEQTTRAYSEREDRSAEGDRGSQRAARARRATLSATLAKHNITLTVGRSP